MASPGVTRHVSTRGKTWKMSQVHQLCPVISHSRACVCVYVLSPFPATSNLYLPATNHTGDPSSMWQPSQPFDLASDWSQWSPVPTVILTSVIMALWPLVTSFPIFQRFSELRLFTGTVLILIVPVEECSKKKLLNLPSFKRNISIGL